MKIGLIVDDTLDKPDGVQQYVLAVGAWMSAQGHEVHYLAGQTTRTDIANVHSLARNIPVRFNGNRLTIPLPVSRRSIRALLTREQFDVLHVQMPYSPFFAHRVLAAAPAGTRLVGTFHILPYGRMARIGNRLLGVLLRRTLGRLDKVLAVSAAARDFAASSYGVHATVVPNGIDLRPFTTATPFEDTDTVPRIVFVNRLVARKGALYLVRAVDYLVNQLHYTAPFKVVICGKGEQAARLAAYVGEHALEAYVTLAGFVSEADKARHIASSAIAVYPSTAGESFGIVLIEALAGSPGVVLGGDNPGYASVLEPYPDQLFDPTDIQSFAAILRHYLEDPASRSQRATVQRQYAARFDISTVGAQILAAYIAD